MPDREALARGSASKGAKEPDLVSWEMIVRWSGDKMRIELRAMDLESVELFVRVWNEARTFDAQRTHRLTFAEARRALDELERSAREVERLGE